MPQVIQLVVEGTDRWHLVLGVPRLLDQLLAHDGGTEPGMEALRPEAGVGLALAIDDGPDVLRQVGQALLGPQPPPLGEGIEAGNATVQLMQPLA
jgi:hypothetical protein